MSSFNWIGTESSCANRYLLQNVLDGRPLAAAAEAELWFWKDPMLLGSFDSRRQKGIGFVAAALRKRAAELLEETGG